MTEATEVTPGFSAYVKEPTAPGQVIVGLGGEIARLVREEQRKRDAEGKRRGDNFSRRMEKLNSRWDTLRRQAHLKANGEKVKAVESPILQDAADRMVAGGFDTAIELARTAHELQPTDPFPLLVLKHFLKEQFDHDVQASLSRVTRKGQIHEIEKREEIRRQAGGAKQQRLF